MQIQIKMKPVPPVGSSFPPTSRVYHRESVRNDGSDDDWDDDYYYSDDDDDYSDDNDDWKEIKSDPLSRPCLDGKILN